MLTEQGENWYHDAHWENVVVAQAELDSEPHHSPLFYATRDAAGEGARNCWPLLPEHQSARRLLLTEHAAGRPMFCSAASMDVDSYIGWGTSSSVDGTFYLYRYDSSPCGGYGKCTFVLRRRRCEQLDVIPDDPTALPAHICVKPEF
ncbi:hypothetical protein ELE36_16695 [Pseudolysobacter antarcticus]|uniref:Uncharacterized protein n=1 Tax=Pseudolysobacter antarcticus TaxID=2511995 RepID=A0A411HN09_9GAMM|nr:hypothetical protein [Pseudolysobacter antarcticus]QBB71862.1 hypothetical protein ELE36_16695 [Pseudolysobacter antarcticus]